MLRLLAALLLSLPLPLVASELVVFLPGATSQIGMQRALESDPACAGLTITVVPKWRALEDALVRKPAMVLAPATFALVPGWRAELQATVAGSDRFRYLLVAANASLTLAQLHEPTVGMLHEVPRESAEGFLAALFPGLAPGHVRLAAKVDDVPNLLGLELARVCVLTPAMLAGAHARLADSLQTLARSRPVWQPMLYVHGGEPADTGRVLVGLAPVTLAALGFERLVARDPALPMGWQAPEEVAP